MARKNLLSSLMNAQNSDNRKNYSDPEQALDPAIARPRRTKGAIGAVGQSIAELKSRSIAEIDPFDIDQGGVTDRLDDNEEDHQALMASIRDYGQQVPVLVRPHPDKEGRFQIVYGRRRVLALRDLKLPVKAMIRDLDDRELVVAQGQENSARRDLTFIEKANFARQMRDGGYDRKVICDALHVDKTQISRMLSVADAVALDLVEAIGSAPSVGRTRWLALAALMQETDTDTATAIALVHTAPADGSDARFEALIKALTLPRRRAKDGADEEIRKTPLRNAGGLEIGQLIRKDGKITMTIPFANAEGFDDWLAENFTRIHRDWLTTRGE